MNRDSALAFRIIKARRTGAGEFRNLTFTPDNVWTVFDRDCADMFRNVNHSVGDVPRTLVPYRDSMPVSGRGGCRLFCPPEIERLLLDAGIPGLFESGAAEGKKKQAGRSGKKESGGDDDRLQFPFPLRRS